MELTYRALRQVLTAVQDQNLTVQELRALLFEIEKQDELVEESEIARMTYKVKGGREDA